MGGSAVKALQLLGMLYYEPGVLAFETAAEIVEPLVGALGTHCVWDRVVRLTATSALPEQVRSNRELWPVEQQRRPYRARATSLPSTWPAQK